VEEVRSLLFDPLSAEQLHALRGISDTLAARLSDHAVWPATADEPACDEQC
jgi:hypothetical protein